jgi:hypothetical protein
MAAAQQKSIWEKRRLRYYVVRGYM